MAKQKFLSIADTDKINLDALIKLLPGSEASLFNMFRNKTRGQYILALLGSWETLDKEGINTPIRVAHFIGQGLVETGWLNYRVESLKYKEEALIKTFSVYRENPALAKQHALKEELIGNTAYGGRMGNNTTGDGFKYRGRGFFQITGKDNYTKYSNVSGVNLLDNPGVIADDLSLSIKVAAAYWRSEKLSGYADANDCPAVSRGVNRGNAKHSSKANHEDLRIVWTNNVLALFKNPGAILPAANAPLNVGSRGDRVTKLQTKLLALGYSGVGTVDGIFGKDTRMAVSDVQHRAGLPENGAADDATLAAIDELLADPRASPSHMTSVSASRGYI